MFTQDWIGYAGCYFQVSGFACKIRRDFETIFHQALEVIVVNWSGRRNQLKMFPLSVINQVNSTDFHPKQDMKEKQSLCWGIHVSIQDQILFFNNL